MLCCIRWGIYQMGSVTALTDSPVNLLGEGSGWVWMGFTPELQSICSWFVFWYTTWIHFRWYHLQMAGADGSGCPQCPSLGNAAHRSTAFWTAFLGRTLIHSCLHPYSFKMILAESRSQAASLTLLTTFSSILKILTGTFFFFLSQCKIFLSLHKEMPSSVWQIHLLGTQYCCVQEHLLLIKGVQLSLQSKVSVQTYFSRLPSGLSS